MQHTITRRALNWISAVLISMLLISGCSSADVNEDNPALSAHILTPAKIEPSRSIPNPTDLPASAKNPPPPTNVSAHSQSYTNETGFRVCENETLVSPNQDLPTSDDGLSMEQDSLIPPAPPANITVSTTQKGVVITWPGTGVDVDKSYNIYHRAGGDDCWEIISIVPIEGDNTGVYEFHATLSSEALAHNFGVSTTDIYGNESILSIIATVPGP